MRNSAPSKKKTPVGVVALGLIILLGATALWQLKTKAKVVAEVLEPPVRPVKTICL